MSTAYLIYGIAISHEDALTEYIYTQIKKEQSDKTNINDENSFNYIYSKQYLIDKKNWIATYPDNWINHDEDIEKLNKLIVLYEETNIDLNNKDDIRTHVVNIKNIDFYDMIEDITLSDKQDEYGCSYISISYIIERTCEELWYFGKMIAYENYNISDIDDPHIDVTKKAQIDKLIKQKFGEHQKPCYKLALSSEYL